MKNNVEFEQGNQLLGTQVPKKIPKPRNVLPELIPKPPTKQTFAAS